MNRLKRKGIWEILYLIWMGLIPLSSSILLGYFGFNSVEAIRSFGLQDLLLFWGAAIFILGLGFFPTTFFALFCGYMWGVQAIVPLFFSYVMASLLGYGLAKAINGQQLLTYLRSKTKISGVLDNVQQNSIYWVFLVRLSPIFPFAITNTLLAYLKVDFKSFLIGGSLGMLPRSLFALWVGSQAATWQMLYNNPDKIGIGNIFSLALLVLSGLGMFYLIRKNSPMR